MTTKILKPNRGLNLIFICVVGLIGRSSAFKCHTCTGGGVGAVGVEVCPKVDFAKAFDSALIGQDNYPLAVDPPPAEDKAEVCLKIIMESKAGGPSVIIKGGALKTTSFKNLDVKGDYTKECVVAKGNDIFSKVTICGCTTELCNGQAVLGPQVAKIGFIVFGGLFLRYFGSF